MNDSKPSDSFSESVAMICEFVIECRAKGHFLPPSDIELIKGWLMLTPHVDTLVLALSNILPDFFSEDSDRKIPRSLKGINRRVITQLKHAAGRNTGL